MEAIVVRETGTDKLICFGPAGRGYDPGVPAGAYKRIEPDYEAVKAEDLRDNPPQPTLRERMLADSAVPQWYRKYL